MPESHKRNWWVWGPIGWVRFNYQARIRNAWINRCWRCVWRPFHG